MNEKKLFGLAVASLFFWALLAGGAIAADCPPTQPWQKIPNYKLSMGTPCKAMGLDTHQGVCQPGQQYETLCDDTKGGRYKTCQGPRQCNVTVVPPSIKPSLKQN